jgi:hypothetical protein
LIPPAPFPLTAAAETAAATVQKQIKFSFFLSSEKRAVCLCFSLCVLSLVLFVSSHFSSFLSPAAAAAAQLYFVDLRD